MQHCFVRPCSSVAGATGLKEVTKEKATDSHVKGGASGFRRRRSTYETRQSPSSSARDSTTMNSKQTAAYDPTSALCACAVLWQRRSAAAKDSRPPASVARLQCTFATVPRTWGTWSLRRSGAWSCVAAPVLLVACSRVVRGRSFFAAVVYPTHASLKAIQSGSREDSLQWLAYWVLHALLTSAEELFDAALAWCARVLLRSR